MSSPAEQTRTVVTGGASGLGAAVVERCTAAGHRVVTIDRTPLDRDAITADLADPAVAKDAVASAIGMLGGLDNLVLCAGTNTPGLAAETDPVTYSRIVAVNLTGMMAAASAAIPALQATGGRLVVIGSTVSRRGNLGQAAYAASKFGAAGFVESLGYELRGSVGVTLVSPGAMDTPWFAQREERWRPDSATLMPPGAVADAVMFALGQPAGISVRELIITHYGATDWP